ncbi:maleylpyruvate isomerase N-terminal domain-containing protein [Nakamurella deserti]|uniref:maleylpyruvate isomerase N-terminal domain-containing protein n=1 Tax=Nakamurella deserti TaxID=2164074 RepID=UPI000DBE5589|nr:maleylpyruvate isomerase N-terminal domain-containing protein [Nakamurella deserti]
MDDVFDDTESDRSDGDLVHGLWTTWAERGATLTAAQWSTPTRLAGWTVRELYAHVAPVPDELLGFLSAGVDGRAAVTDGRAAVTDGAGILRAYNRADGLASAAAPAVADAAVRTAAALSTADLVDRFRGVTEPSFAARLRAVPPDRVVGHPVLGSVTVAALLEVAVMEQTVHLLDLIAAVGGPAAPAAAVRRSLQVVAAVADPVGLLEVLTGRGGTSLLPVIR